MCCVYVCVPMKTNQTLRYTGRYQCKYCRPAVGVHNRQTISLADPGCSDVVLIVAEARLRKINLDAFRRLLFRFLDRHCIAPNEP